MELGVKFELVIELLLPRSAFNHHAQPSSSDLHLNPAPEMDMIQSRHALIFHRIVAFLYNSSESIDTF